MRMQWVLKRARYLLPFVLLLGATVLWVANCSGPRPVADHLTVQAPSAPDKPYRVTARVQNDGTGHGQVRVVFRLRDLHSGRVYQQSEMITLQGGETIIVGVDITAPPGAYSPEVTVNYPP
ncbi:MAG TPA: hypothetical protein VFW76_10615 [Ktedonobacterales bacterium]|nr:hypothetical protein [Ktedonobacterales bacterium]